MKVTHSRWQELAWRALFAGLILLGILARLRQYLFNRALWLDEAMLALNIINRSFSGLLKPLGYDQGAPLGFLMALKLVVSLFGKSEYAFRLIPFLASCFALVLLYCWGRRLTGPLGLAFLLGVFTASYRLVSYAVEAKQYSSDMALTLALYLLAFHFFDSEPNQWDFVILAIGGSAALWFSHPVLFTLGGIGLVLLFKYFHTRDRQRLIYTLGTGLFWGTNFTILYFIQFRGLAKNYALTNFWAEYFMPMPPWSNWLWFKGTFSGLFHNPLGLAEPHNAILILFILGLAVLFHRHWQWSLTFIVSILLTLIASTIHKYPFGARMILFLMPGFALGIGEGIESVRKLFGRVKLPSMGWIVGVSLAGGLLFQPAAFGWENFAKPKKSEDIRPAMAFLAQNRKTGDVIYVYPGGVPAFRFYAAHYGFKEADFIAGTGYDVPFQHYLDEIDRFIGQKRVWVLFSHLFENKGIDEKAAFLDHLDQVGNKKKIFIIPGTSVYLYLYDLTPR